MRQIKDILLAEETLFKNHEVFDPDYLPEHFSFRDAQIKELTYCLKPGMRNARPLNSFIFGVPATGKTTAVKILFQELEKATSKIVPVHINCQLYPTQYKIISEIHRKLFGFVPPETGVPLAGVYDKIFSKLKKDKKVLVVALDDVNHLFLSGHANDIIYSILRAHEAYGDVTTSVWAIGTDNFLYKLENKVRSIFQPQEILFQEYAKNEVHAILSRRSDMGFYSNVINKKLVEKIAASCVDLRHGIELLKQSAIFAEADACRKIEDAHVEKALKKMPGQTGRTPHDESAVLLDVIKKHAPVESGRLFKILEDYSDFSYTKFYRMLQKLKEANLLIIKPVSKKRGRSSLICLK